MDLNENIKIAESTLSKQIAWIQAPESRISLILPVATVMLTVLGALSSENACWTVLEIGLVSIAAGLLILSLIFLFFAVKPQLGGPKKSVIYFGKIASITIDEYRDVFKSLTLEEYQNDLISQIHRNAEIANRKYKYVKYSIRAMFTGFIPWLITAAIFFLT